MVSFSKAVQLQEDLYKGVKAAAGPEKTSENDAGSEKSGDDFEKDERGSEDFRKELERLQIATIYSLVEQVPMDGRNLNMLFLTVTQAAEFNFTDIDKVMNAMEIKPRPKLIVTITKSMVHCGATQSMYSHPGQEDLFTPRCYMGQKNRDDLKETETEMATLLKDYLLPVCIKTNALVLLHDATCALSSAFGDICQAERGKRNGSLPFTVLAIVGAHAVANRAQYDADSRARIIRRGSRRWRQYNHLFMDVFGRPAACDELTADFPAGLTHAILISSVNEEKNKKDIMAYKLFKSALVDRLSRELPSVALMSFSMMGDPLTLLSEYLGRKLPVVLIDSRELTAKPVIMKSGSQSAAELQQMFVDHARLHLETIESDLEKSGTWNFFETSTLAFLHSQLDQFTDMRLNIGVKDSELSIGKIPESKPKQWLYMAIAEKTLAAEMEGSVGFEDAPERSLATAFAKLYVDMLVKQDANRRKFLFKILDDFSSAVDKCEVIDEFDRVLQAHTLMMSQSSFYVGPEKKSTGSPCATGGDVPAFWKTYPSLFDKVPLFKDGRVYCYYAAVVGADERDGEVVTLAACKEAALALVTARRKDAEECLKPELPMLEYMAIKDILLSPYSYSGNLDDPAKLNSALSKIARIDRLPPENSLGGLTAIKYAWDAIDICNHVADLMKTLTKISYVLLLVLGITTGSITVVHLNEPDLYSEGTLNLATAALALISGLVAAAVSNISPATKWTRLRGAALAIESEVWRFRTRSGIYAENANEYGAGGDEPVEHVLEQRAESIKLQALKSSGVLNTSFMSLFSLFGDPKNKANFKHGQYQGCGVEGTFGAKGTVFGPLKATAESAKTLLNTDVGKSGDDGPKDDYFSPCRPSEYLAYRVRKASEFYQARLPVYHRIKSNTHTVLLLGTSSGVVLALADLASWAAILTAVVGAVTAWSEFNGTEDKLTSYSDAVTQVDSILLWWKMLTPVDQSSVAAICELVDRCEAVFRDERQAWVSLNFDHSKMKSKQDDGNGNEGAAVSASGNGSGEAV